MLRRYPRDTTAASSALFLLGDLASDDRADARARGYFRRVVTRYPSSRFAPTAAFRAAMIALLSGRPAGITQVHGQPQDVVLGGNPVTLYPIFHPAAALYTPRMLAVLQEDFARIPQLLGRAVAPPPEPQPEPVAVVQPEQLGLF